VPVTSAPSMTSLHADASQNRVLLFHGWMHIDPVLRRRYVALKQAMDRQEAEVMKNVGALSLTSVRLQIHFAGKLITSSVFQECNAPTWRTLCAKKASAVHLLTKVQIRTLSGLTPDTQLPPPPAQVRGWKVGESVYSDGRWMAPTKLVGIWGAPAPVLCLNIPQT